MAGVGFDDSLHGRPDLEGNDGGDVIGDSEIAEPEDADVDLVLEEGGVGVEGFEQAGGIVDVGEGMTGGAELKGMENQGGGKGINHPAVGNMRLAITAGADLDGLCLETSGGRAGDGAIILDEAAQTAGYIF